MTRSLTHSVAPGSTGRVTPDYEEALFPPPPPESRSILHNQIFDHGYLPFAYTGDVLSEAGPAPQKHYAFFWGGNPPSDAKAVQPPGSPPPPRIQRSDSFDIVRGIVFDGGSIPPSLGEWGTSTTLDDPTNFKQVHLRTADPVESLSAQSLRAAWYGSGTTPALRVVTSTAGGSAQLLDGLANINSAAITAVALDETPDHGYGGCALALADVLGTDEPLVFFGTLFAHAGAGNMVSSLHIYEVGGSNFDVFVPAVEVVFDGTGGRPELFGLCGIALGDLDPPGTDTDGVEEELVLTTLNGDVVIIELAATGSGPSASLVVGNVIYHQVFDGAMGASNSILIQPGAVPVLYIASSMGMRKLTRSF